MGVAALRGETAPRRVVVISTLGQPVPPDRSIFDELVDGVWERARWSNGGPLASALERRLEQVTGWEHIAVTASGTSALTAALLALDLPRGGEVITTPLTFRATTLAIESAGLVPVFADVDRSTLNLDPAAVEKAIGDRTVAILPVHLFGVAVEPALDVLAASHSLPVVYDAAHAYGLPDVIGRGVLTAYSLHATKLLHTGEGGFVATESALLDDRVRHAVNFGIDGGSDTHAGINGKLPEIAAALGLATLPRIGAEVAAREAIRAAYASAIASSGRMRPHAPGHERALVMEVVRCDPRDQQRIIRELADRDVIARTFPALCADGQRYAGSRVVGGDAREVAELARTAIALPIHGRMPRIHIDAVAEVLST
ncbi:DegT/DnrJ/EryC1/StrS family aminotransferase [Microbacteriaceae bacterium VKM Ac-2855]|nr:DegT/DnrJ/EryC1/StrS family aminotransferase [Microbacteriaceae bacterium VKM Ac-2855]